jgi:hypothetical protein
LFISLFILAGAVTWDGPKTLLPVIGMVSGAIAFWMKNLTLIRALSLTGPPLWFTYNYIVGSYAGMIVEVITVTSVLIAIWRYDIKLKHKLIAKN